MTITGVPTSTSTDPGTAVPGVDALRWPDIAHVPHTPVRAGIARRLFRHAAGRVPLRVVEPGGTWYGAGTGADPVFRLVRPEAFFHRLAADLQGVGHIRQVQGLASLAAQRFQQALGLLLQPVLIAG